MILYAIIESGGDEYTFWYDNVVDSIWSTEELALKRLYFLENFYKNLRGFKSQDYNNYEIKEIQVDTIPNFNVDVEREKEWLKVL